LRNISGSDRRSESLNGSRVEAYAKGYIRLNVICLIFA